MGILPYNNNHWIQPASPKLQVQKSPPGLRRAGFQDFVDWLW